MEWDAGWCTVLGVDSFPENTVVIWRVKVVNCYQIMIGVAPASIDVNDEYNCYKSGWYLHCQNNCLYSGPPFNYVNKYCGFDFEPVPEGETVVVEVNTTTGDISFTVREETYLAFQGIPLDEKLFPCVLLWNTGNIVKLKDDPKVKIARKLFSLALCWERKGSSVSELPRDVMVYLSRYMDPRDLLGKKL
jgi:hypothetical protein